MGLKYNFPKNKRAAENTLYGQLGKLDEELAEIWEAAEELDGNHIIEECCDLEYAIEGILRKFPKKQVDSVYEEVVEKAHRRNDVI